MADWSGIARLNDAVTGVAALAYAGAGLPVFPLFWLERADDGSLRCSCGGGPDCKPGKHPLVKWTELATTDRDAIRDWWTRWPNANVGVPTGSRSGIVALDLDLQETEHPNGFVSYVDGEVELGQWLERELGPGGADFLAGTLAQATGGGGKQLIFRDPAGVRTVVRWLPAVDIKADGGYVVVPPSLHRSGRRYGWLNEEAPADLPERIAATLRVARGAPGRRTAEGDAGRSSGAVAEYDYRQAKVDGPPAGARDDFFNARAFEMRRTGWSLGEAKKELRRLWELTPGGGAASSGRADPYRWETVVEKVDRAWRDVAPDPDGHEPVTDELLAWARGAAQTASPAEAGPSANGRTGAPDAGGAGPRGPASTRVVAEPPSAAEVATDLGNAARFARVHADRVRYVHGVGWFVWDGRRWAPDDRGRVVTLVRDVVGDIRRQAERSDADERDRWVRWALASESAARVSATLKLAEAEPGVALTPDQLDAHPHLLCCRNGTLDLRAGELGPHRPEHLLTNVTEVDYSPDATSTLLDEFHATFLPDPAVAAYAYRVLGAALFGGNRDRAFVIVLGQTTTGKSTWVDGISGALGTYVAAVNSSVYRGTLGDAPRPDLLHVVRKRLVVAEEASRSWDLHTDQVKRLTGGVPIVARKMRSDVMVQRVPDFTPVVVTNEMPHLKGADSAVRRRIVALPFVNRVEREDVDRKAAFATDPGVRTAILALLVRGCLERRAPDLSDAPTAVILSTMLAYEGLDDVAEFVGYLREEGRLVEDDAIPTMQCIGTMALHAEYVQWVNVHGSNEDRRNRLGSKSFSQRLEAYGWRRVRSNGSRWAGKALRSFSSAL